jgi:hypothetical protein
MKTPEGQIYGPVNRTSLEQWVREGRVTDDCQLRRGEHGAWTGAAKIFTQLAAPQYSPTQVGGGTYASGYGAGHAHVQTGHSTGGRYLRPHRGGLIITFAILGWAFCPIFSIMAWSMGTTDMNQMRAGIMDNSGMGITQAGQILGMIHVCLTLLGLGFVFLMILCGVALDA